jgi:hypothetical protein
LSQAGKHDWIVNLVDPVGVAYHHSLIDAGPGIFLRQPLGAARLAVYAQEKRIPMLSIQREGYWLQSLVVPHATRYSEKMLESPRWRVEFIDILKRVDSWRLLDIEGSASAERIEVREFNDERTESCTMK